MKNKSGFGTVHAFMFLVLVMVVMAILKQVQNQEYLLALFMAFAVYQVGGIIYTLTEYRKYTLRTNQDLDHLEHRVYELEITLEELTHKGKLR